MLQTQISHSFVSLEHIENNSLFEYFESEVHWFEQKLLIIEIYWNCFPEATQLYKLTNN